MHAATQQNNRGRALLTLSSVTAKTKKPSLAVVKTIGSTLALSFSIVAGAAAVLLPAGAAQAQEIKGDPEAAKAKISMCTGCHAIAGYRASFPTVYRVPLIAGQKEQYLINALNAYRKGDRDHPTMRGIAGALTDQDIADLAAFYAQAE